ncbi:MAG TPA: SLC13 family permease, partial [Acidobacteriota bacterium]|nr:SLC13 family permease [Acidobacteriota bacterium]
MEASSRISSGTGEYFHGAPKYDLIDVFTKPGALLERSDWGEVVFIMLPQALFALVVAVASILVLALTSLPADLVLLSALALFLLTGLTGPVEALSGFSNEGTITIAALFVLAAGLKETGALSLITTRLFGRPQSVVRTQARLIIPVTALSAFLNNTPIVATFMPAVIDWARKQRISVSKLLMPLSFAAILGGTATLIGTSTNLVVHGLIRSETDLPGFGFFELAWVGIPCAIVGTIYV